MKVSLSVLERIFLLNALPAEGDITTIRIVSDLRKEISFSETELSEWKISKEDSGAIEWDGEKAEEKEIDFGAKEHTIVAEALKKVSDNGKVTEKYISTYNKFSEDGDESTVE